MFLFFFLSLSDEDELWNTCAFYIAQLCVSLILLSSVEHISIGGGVMSRTCLYPLIRGHVLDLLKGYIESDKLTIPNIDYFITPSIW